MKLAFCCLLIVLNVVSAIEDQEKILSRQKRFFGNDWFETGVEDSENDDDEGQKDTISGGHDDGGGEADIFDSFTNMNMGGAESKSPKTETKTIRKQSAPEEEFGLYEGDMKNDVLKEIKSARLDMSEILWPGGVVPFVISHEYDSDEKDIIREAAALFGKHTCLKWVEKSRAPVRGTYINIYKERGCWSWVGKVEVDGAQDLSLDDGCVMVGTALHEMTHAVGIYHEQSRFDRDDYVKIVWENIKDRMEPNFHKTNLFEMLNLAPYDYKSIMHYNKRAFSSNGKETIVPYKKGTSIGQRDTFSEVDIFEINKLYNCPQYESATLAPQFYQKPEKPEPILSVLPVKCNFDVSECDFEQPYRSDHIDWVREKPDDSSTDSVVLYLTTIDANNVVELDAKVLSTRFTIAGDLCIKFKYKFFGSEEGTLKLFTKKDKSDPRQKWLKTDANTDWVPVEIGLSGLNGVYQVMWEGTSKNQDADMGIDDVIIDQGSCGIVDQKPIKPEPTTQVNVIKPGKTGTMLPFTCSPRETDMCGFTNEAENYLQWMVMNNRQMGESFVLRTKRGRHYFEYGRLVSPLFSEVESVCVDFDYKVKGELVRLKLYHVKDDGVNEVIWQSDFDESSSGVKRSKAVGTQFRGSDRIGFEGNVRNKRNDRIFISNIKISLGVCEEEEEIGEKKKLPFDCDFEEGYCGFEQDQTDSFDWTRHHGHTPSRRTGPKEDHTTGKGHYIYTEASEPQERGDIARIASPWLDNDEEEMCLSFYYHMKGYSMGTLRVLLESNDGERKPIFGVEGNQGRKWKYSELNLEVEEGPVRIIFEGIVDGSKGDMSIDDVKVVSGLC